MDWFHAQVLRMTELIWKSFLFLIKLIKIHFSFMFPNNRILGVFRIPIDIYSFRAILLIIFILRDSVHLRRHYRSSVSDSFRLKSCVILEVFVIEGLRQVISIKISHWIAHMVDLSWWPWKSLDMLGQMSTVLSCLSKHFFYFFSLLWVWILHILLKICTRAPITFR